MGRGSLGWRSERDGGTAAIYRKRGGETEALVACSIDDDDDDALP